MITKEQAIQIVRDSVSEDLDVDLEAITETAYGWYMYAQSRKFLQTRNAIDMAVGSGGYLVDRESGKKYDFASCFTQKENLKIFELGFLKFDEWDIEVTRVVDERDTVAILTKLNVGYIPRDIVAGVQWKVPVQYKVKELKLKLRQLPVKFNIGKIYFNWKEIRALKDQRAFNYNLIQSGGVDEGI